MRTIELVTHCWRYSRVLNYQLASIRANPPADAKLMVTVFVAKDDPMTHRVVGYWWERSKCLWPDVTIRQRRIPSPQLLRREIGRNKAALASIADLIWFLDCDYVFGPDCLETLATIDLPDDKLFYPQHVWINKTHALGDEYARRAAEGPSIYNIDPDDFERRKERKAIGGLQIVPGDVARQYGYCRDDKKLQSPVTDGKWQTTKGDYRFREILGTSGTAIDLPNLYRIRQTTEGAVDTLKETPR